MEEKKISSYNEAESFIKATESLNLAKINFKRDSVKYKFYEKQDNLFSCSFNTCNKQFNTEQKMKKHVRSHLYKKKIVCQFPGCTKRFSSTNNLKVCTNIA